jgi:hypothetical protein
VLPNDDHLVLEELLIRSSDGGGILCFFDRIPYETDREISQFSVRAIDQNLSAAIRVYAGYRSLHPVKFFEELAVHAHGWPGEMTWESLEGELRLPGSHDGLGHVKVRIDIQNGPLWDDWKVSTTIVMDAGQLERLAKHAALFFGK